MTAALPFPAKHTVPLKKSILTIVQKKVLRLFMQMEEKNQKDEAEEHNILHF